MKKRVLITGGAGLVGSHLVDNLMIEGHEVIVIDNFNWGKSIWDKTLLQQTEVNFLKHLI